jgi:uncharacterized protein (DUF305 family)
VKRTIALVAIAAALLAAPLLWGAGAARAQALDTLNGEEFEKAFLQQMIMHHAMAVMMAQPIPEKAIHDELKATGQSIISSQTAEIEQMRGWLKDWYGIDAPMPMMDGQGMTPGVGSGQGMMPGVQHGPGMMPGMGPGMMQNQGQGTMPGMGQGMGMDMMGMMNGLTGARLEATFMTMMIPHHEGAVTMARLAGERAVHPELKQLAEQIIADQSREIGQFNQWLGGWYNL